MYKRQAHDARTARNSVRAEDGPRTRDRFDIIDGMDWSVQLQLVYVSKHMVATMDAQAVQSMGQVEDID